MHGFVKNPYNYLESTDVFVLSSRYEGLPKVLIESLSLKTPVISTSCKSEPKEILNNSEFEELVLEKAMKETVKRLFNKLGYDIHKIQKFNGSYSPYSSIELSAKKVVDLESLARISLSIPGMITTKSGQLLYTLCYMQELKGDVVEIGSWQGRSASFLARAVENSKNGSFFAIDHFRGNVGKENYYVVGNEDLSDLKEGFLSNMKRIGLSESVHLYDMPNQQAATELKDTNIRFLFIDGDHTKEGVEKDIELFFPNLMPGSIVVFDDFSKTFPGLIQAVDQLIQHKAISKIMSYSNTLVLMV
ncbi:class I SAM-dependent methyltransferase [Pseudomonadota bacterium]